MDEYRVVATHSHQTKPDVYTVSAESFRTPEDAQAWMNYGGGEQFSAACTIDTNGCDDELINYWLDEVEVWTQAQVDAKGPMSVQVVIDEEFVKPTEPESHTYVTHLQFSARDDAHARLINARIREVITDWQASIDAEQDEPLMILPQGYAVEAAHLTDADDWAEHIDTNEDVCYQCGEAGGTNRSRAGKGYRVCAPCAGLSQHGPYPIEDVAI